MKIYEEKSLSDFGFWGGAVETAEMLTEDDFEIIERMMEELDDCWSETAVNDLFWFDDESIAQWLGYDSWAELEKDRTTEEEG